jgi:hypothetical protein
MLPSYINLTSEIIYYPYVTHFLAAISSTSPLESQDFKNILAEDLDVILIDDGIVETDSLLLTQDANLLLTEASDTFAANSQLQELSENYLLSQDSNLLFDESLNILSI